MAKDQRLGINLDAEQLKMLDAARGGMNRSEFIRRAIAASVAEKAGVQRMKQDPRNIPPGGTKAAAIAEGIRRLEAGDIGGAMEVREMVGESSADRLGRDVVQAVRTYFKADRLTGSALDTFGRCGSLADLIREANRQADGPSLSASAAWHVFSGGRIVDRKTGESSPSGGWNRAGNDGGIRVIAPSTRGAYAFQTVSDFSGLVADVFSRIIIESLEADPGAYRAISRASELEDFKESTLAIIKSIDRPKELSEHGAVERGLIRTSEGSVSLATYATSFSISRQAFLGSANQGEVVRDYPKNIATAVTRLEADLLFAALQSSDNLPDGAPFFHASRGNLASSGGTVSDTTLGTAWVAVKGQTAGDGGIADYRPTWILTAPSRRLAASKILANYTSGDSAPLLEIHDDPRITGNQWFIGCDPATRPALGRFSLNEERQTWPTLMMQNRFSSDGVSIRIIHDFGAAPIDPAAIYKNLGN